MILVANILNSSKQNLWYIQTNTLRIRIYSRHAKKFKYQETLNVINHINRLKTKKIQSSQ